MTRRKRRARRAWRMPVPCADCPFNEDGAGRRLRDSLRPGRFEEITAGLLAGAFFTCHKTTPETGDGSNLVCAGSLRFQELHGVSSNYQRVCESLEYFARERAKRSR